MAAFHLTVATPDGLYFTEFVQKVLINNGEGELNILPHHTPYTAALSEGKLKIFTENDVKVARVNGGFVKASDEGVTILADGCY